jgi:transposase
LPRAESAAPATEKKSLTASERNNRKRAWFWRKLKKIVHNRLKFIDEAGVTTIMTRLRARAAPGERIREAVPKNYGQSTSMLSLMSLSGVETTMLVEGAVDTICFDVFCQEFLRPCLKAGDVIVLDNLGAHKASQIEVIARQCNASVIWLPPYSPDFSPIELMWSKLKTYLRKSKARSKAELDRAVAEGLKLITESDCLSWFKHCGYQVA